VVCLVTDFIPNLVYLGLLKMTPQNRRQLIRLQLRALFNLSIPSNSSLLTSLKILCIRDAKTLLCEVRFGGKGRVRLPFCGCTRVRLFQHLVDLLKGKALGLRDKEVSEGETDTAEATPHEEDV
jgi:hypothetical protein